jgi:pimeloyl-ACP methyl ester carboxylesterase
MPRASETVLIGGPTGPVQTLVDEPETLRGLALVAHPHPLIGGANNNKVVYTLAHCLRDFGYLALRPNFRGVGKSAGIHDHGVGETEDLLAVLDYARGRWDPLHGLPVLLAGYSFGTFVQTRVAKRLAEAGQPAEQLILLAMAAGPIEGNSLGGFFHKPTYPYQMWLDGSFMASPFITHYGSDYAAQMDVTGADQKDAFDTATLQIKLLADKTKDHGSRQRRSREAPARARVGRLGRARRRGPDRARLGRRHYG